MLIMLPVLFEYDSRTVIEGLLLVDSHYTPCYFEVFSFRTLSSYWSVIANSNFRPSSISDNHSLTLRNIIPALRLVGSFSKIGVHIFLMLF